MADDTIQKNDNPLDQNLNANTAGGAPLGDTPNALGAINVPGADKVSGTTTGKPKSEKKKIEVDPDVLERLLNRVEKVENDNKILREVADKNRLTRVEEMRAQGKLIKKVNLNTYEGKIIIGWKKVKDDVYMDQEGRLHEDQISGLIFQGESEVGKEMDIRSFSRLIVKVPAEVIEESKDRDGNTNFLVRTEDGQEVKIDSRFIN